MNYKETILNIIQGKQQNQAVFVPRLDIWYNTNAKRGTLPAGYKNLSYPDLINKLEVGYHSVIPDFIKTENIENLHHRGLGFYNGIDYPYTVDFTAIDFQVEQTATEISTTYYCTHGEIKTKFLYNKNLSDSGVTLPAVTEHAIKQHSDYKLLAEIFSKVKIEPAPDNIVRYEKRIGQSGIPVAYISLACGPMQHILRDLREFIPFIYDLYDIPELMNELCEVLSGLYENMLDAFLISKADVGLFGGNYDDTLTSKPFFDQHISPWLSMASRRFHEKNKLLLTHTDGENQALNPSLIKCRFDIADSICPKPMTKLSLKEYREIYKDRITIWGGIPSVITLESTCSFTDFKQYIDEMLEYCKPYDKLIFGIADTTPSDADFGRIEYIRDRTGYPKRC